MANTDPVQIVVEIVDQFSDDLKDLRAELEKIDKKDIEPEQRTSVSRWTICPKVHRTCSMI